MSWTIISGYSGYVSFGHNFLIGVSAYMTVVLVYHLGLPLYITMPIGVAAAVAAVFGFYLPALRIRGPYFTLVTLSLLIVVDRIVITLDPVTGGTRGLFAFEQLVLGAVPNFYLSLGLLVLSGIVLSYLARSDYGSVLLAIHQDEDVVDNIGLNPNRFKFYAFIVDALIVGIGAVFFVHYLGSISPESVFAIFFIINIIIAAVIGGTRSIPGAILGAYILIFLLEGLRPFAPGAIRIIIYSSVALILFVIRPKGLFPEVEKLVNRFRGRRGSKK
jgi:branched-chain amino acid transport system permease protein